MGSVGEHALFIDMLNTIKFFVIFLFLVTVISGGILYLSSFGRSSAGGEIGNRRGLEHVLPLIDLSVAPVDSAGVSALQDKSNPQIFLVTRVVDGDTIVIEGGKKVRYIGIDTPETVDPRKPVQCFGKEASARNKELVLGKRVRLEKDITDADKYGRLLRYVYVDDEFVNLRLVEDGFAFSYTYPPDVKYQKKITKAQRQAREEKRGLWAACSGVTKLPASAKISVNSLSSSTMDVGLETRPGCVIKGNIGSTGDKIYHLPGCGSYAKTSIDQARGERWFCSEQEAISVGWRKVKNCS